LVFDRWEVFGGRVFRGRCQGLRTYLEEVVEEVGMLLEVEGDGLVVHLNVGDLNGHILELHMLPCQRMLHDNRAVSQRCVVWLFGRNLGGT
jgi:hypothetical protein